MAADNIVLLKCGTEGSCVENFVKFSRKKCFRLHFFINLVSGKHFLLRAVFSRNFRCKSPHFSNTFSVICHSKSESVKQNTDLKKIFNHFIFRIQQGFRIFNLNPKISLPILLVLGALIAVKLPSNYYYPSLFFALTLTFHINRKDISFLKKVFVKNWRLIIYIESAIIYAIFLLGNINYKIEKIGISLFFTIILFSFFYPKEKPNFSLKWNFIPDSLFEWRSFLRKNTWFAIIGYVIIILSAYQTALLIFVGIFILDYFSNIYEHNESKEMLEMYFKKHSFEEKLKTNLYFFNILLLPTYLGFLILNYEDSNFLIYYFVFMNLYFLLILTRKYKIYDHKEKTNYYNMGVYLEYFFCSIIIIPAFFVLRENIKTAKRNIKLYVGS